MRGPPLVVINLSPALGGAEVYTHTLVRAALARGFTVTLVTAPAARFWDGLDWHGAERIITDEVATALQRIERHALVINQTSLPERWLSALSAHPRFISVAHHTQGAANRYAYYPASRLLLAISRHVIANCQAVGLTKVWPEPLLGVANLARTGASEPLVAHPVHEWDRRKARDRLLGWAARAARPFQATRPYVKRPGLTLGVVSRITDLKQFPALFTALLPALAQAPAVNLEIFGSGLYKKVRTLQRVLAPLGERVRWWGWQSDLPAVYAGIDYLLAGLPEREALGLNVIEAQVCGTPVLAVAAPPFTETVCDGESGYLFADPRVDDAADFARLLTKIADPTTRPDPRRATGHLRQFAFEVFAERLERVLVGALSQLPEG